MDRNNELEEVVPNDSDPLIGRENRESESSVELSPPQPATVNLLEIEDEETDGSSAACCRICLEAESEIGDGPYDATSVHFLLCQLVHFILIQKCFCLVLIFFLVVTCSKI